MQTKGDFISAVVQQGAAPALMRQLLQAAPTPETTREKVVKFFEYYPDRTVCIVALALFAAITLIIALILGIKRRQYYMFIVVFTGCCEVGGYLCRLVFLSSPGFGGYTAMQCFLIISPTFLALANYVTVGKMMRIAGAAKVWIFKPSWVYRFFFASDLLCLALQGAGAGVSVNPNGKPPNQAGKPLLLIGLAGQLLFFAVFALLIIYMHTSSKYALKARRDLDLSFFCLYITTGLLFIRNTYRVIEFAQGWHGYLANHQTYFYFFDTLLVFLTFIVYAALHSSIFLPTAPAAVAAADRPSSQAGNDAVQLASSSKV